MNNVKELMGYVQGLLKDYDLDPRIVECTFYKRQYTKIKGRLAQVPIESFSGVELKVLEEFKSIEAKIDQNVVKVE